MCEEFEETVTEAWYEDQQEQERKEREKREKRVYDNWKKLIKGLMIRARLQRKYNFVNEDEEDNQDAAAKKPGPSKDGDKSKKKSLFKKLKP